MKIGLTYNTKTDMGAELRERGLNVADDALEEYDAPETIAAISAALQALGHDVSLLGWGRKMLATLATVPQRPDLVFNIAEGLGGRSREAQVPAVLEMLGVPFVGSDAMALAVSLDKQATKELVQASGLTVPRGFLATDPFTVYAECCARKLDFPLIVKPNAEGSSKGILKDSVVRSESALSDRVRRITETYQQPALIEEYIWGREVTVGIVGDPPRILGVMEVLAAVDDVWTVYSLEAKRDWKKSVNYSCPAELPPDIEEAVHAAALGAFQALGCRDVSRVDFRIREGVPVFLEINPLPGLSAPPESSDLVLIAEAVGLSYEALIGEILGGAIRRS